MHDKLVLYCLTTVG